MRRILIVQSLIPSYRVGFFNALVNCLPNFTISSGLDDATTNTKPSHEELMCAYELNDNKYYFNRRFWRQSNLLRNVFKFDDIVVTFSIRNIDIYWLIFLSVIKLKRIYFWGHIKGRHNIGASRLFLASLANKFIFYTKSDLLYAKKSIFSHHFQSSTFLGNTCVSRATCDQNLLKLYKNRNRNNIKRNNFIYSGRLVSEKGVLDAVVCFLQAKEQLRESIGDFLIVGDGPQRAEICRKIEKSPVGHHVILLGEVFDPNLLANYYDSCVFSVCNGYVGLNAVQSFANGVPMFIRHSENHSPEIECCIESFNCIYYDSGMLFKIFMNVNDISLTKIGIRSRVKIIANIKRKYTFETMALNFSATF